MEEVASTIAMAFPEIMSHIREEYRAESYRITTESTEYIESPAVHAHSIVDVTGFLHPSAQSPNLFKSSNIAVITHSQKSDLRFFFSCKISEIGVTVMHTLNQ